MKKYISIFLSVILYAFGALQSANAIICANCSQVAVQIPQAAQGIIDTAANVLSSVNSVADDLNKYVLDPIANETLAVTQIQKQLDTINFITAAFGNEGSLLIQNPEQWIKSKGKGQVQIALGSIQQQNGIYKDSLLASVIGTYKSADDLNKTIKDLSNSNIPNAVQKNICNDSSLTNLAKNDVMLSDGSYDATLLQKRKGELYNQLCVSNPLTNAQLAKTLSIINQQMPSIGGWDTWLLMTGGDNPYTHSAKVGIALAKKVDETEQAKKDELNRNGGIANKTDCLERGYPINDDEGNPMPDVNDTSLPCAIEQITQTGNALNSQLQEALNAPLRKLQASFGTGIFRSLTSIMSIVGSMEKMQNAFNGQNRGTSAGSSVQVTYTKDLTDPTQQAQTAENVQDPLNKHLQSLSKLETTENSFLNVLSNYESQIKGIKQCYDSVVNDYPNAANDPRVTSAYAFINAQQASINSQRATSNSNLSKIDQTRTLINNTLTSVSNSQSTQEITKLFIDYQKQVKAQGLPDFSTGPQREADLTRYRGDIQVQSLEGGPLPTYTSNCSSVRQQYAPYSNGGGY